MSDPRYWSRSVRLFGVLDIGPRNHHLKEQQGLLIAEPSNLIKIHVLHGKVIKLS